MSKNILVTGLVLGKESKICECNNVNFDWIFSRSSDLIWADDFKSYNINLHTLNEMANVFLSETENKGYKAMLYSSQYYLENIWEKKYDTWIAKYSNTNNYEGDYIIWQLCSDGIIDGIDGYVDIDVMYE